MTAPSRLKVFLRDLALVLALDSVVAFGITLFALSGIAGVDAAVVDRTLALRVLAGDMVYSHAIGLTIFGLVELARLTWWWQRRPSLASLVLVMSLAIPVGYLVGGFIASVLTAGRFELLLSLGPSALITGTATLGTSILAMHFILQRERLAEERRRAESADLHARSARLQLLQQQIEPHMLFNTLANVHALIDEEPAGAQRMLEALSEMLHASMQMKEQPLVSLQQEFALLGHYLRLMSIRMGPRLHYVLELPAELEQVQLPPLSVQPLVENAVKHGLEPSVQGGTLRVTARAEGSQLVVEVADDGLGLDVDNPFDKGRVGLRNVRKRLAFAFGERASLQLRANPPGGVVAALSVPR